MTRKFLIVLCIFVLFASFLLSRHSPAETYAYGRTTANSYSSHSNFISISVIIDENRDFDDLYSWLTSVNYTNFDFIVYASNSESYILDNSTRVNILKHYGNLVPRLPYYQTYSPEERKALLDDELNNYSVEVGYIPKGIMDFAPDTYTANYALSRGIEYVQGYCFDQYAIDYITERGGFQMPYYANSRNILVPSASGGIVVLPHSTWDWVASFTVNHALQAHVVNLMKTFNDNSISAKDYFLTFIDRTFSGSSPFGFFNFQFEWSSTLSAGYSDVAKDWITTLMARYPDLLVTYEELVDWFKANYPSTPEYRISFTSPYDNENIEWYYGNEDRVARIGNKVVSYVDYLIQLPDKYMTQTASILWNESAYDPDNGVDDSLTFGVDALGGGNLRAPASTLPVPYTGDLKDFNMHNSTSSRQLTTAYLYTSAVLIVALTMTTFYFALRKPKRRIEPQ
jgi:hypothetical protein